MTSNPRKLLKVLVLTRSLLADSRKAGEDLQVRRHVAVGISQTPAPAARAHASRQYRRTRGCGARRPWQAAAGVHRDRDGARRESVPLGRREPGGVDETGETARRGVPELVGRDRVSRSQGCRARYLVSPPLFHDPLRAMQWLNRFPAQAVELPYHPDVPAAGGCDRRGVPRGDEAVRVHADDFCAHREARAKVPRP